MSKAKPPDTEPLANPMIDRAAEILLKIRALARVDSSIKNKFPAILASHNTVEQNEQLDDLITAVREAISETENRRRYSEPMQEKMLRPEEYYLHPDLKGIHAELKSRFASDENLSAWPYKGILLSGPPGTGKTEYSRFLAAEVGGQAEFHTVNISELGNNAMAGQALLAMYRDLEAQAKTTKRYIVLLFDEFESLVRIFANEETTIKTSTESYGEKGSSVRHEDRRKIQISQKGEELMAVFKSILSGTGDIERVFTICTSNEEDFGQALVRGGRLRQVPIAPFSVWGLSENRKEILWDYQNFPTLFSNAIGVLQAINFRLSGKTNQNLKKWLDKLTTAGKKAEAQVRTASKDYTPIDYFQNDKRSILQKIWLKHFLAVFGYEIDEKFRFHSDFASQCNLGPRLQPTQEEFPETAKHYPSELAKFFKQSREAFEDELQTGELLAHLFFPQIRTAQVIKKQ